MNCLGCLSQYNETDRSPRLLISCGHSICEKCTAELYRDGKIICPQCQFKNIAPMVTCFPRNITLLNHNKQTTLTTQILPSTIVFQNTNTLNQNASQNYGNKDINQTQVQHQQSISRLSEIGLNNYDVGKNITQQITPLVQPQSQSTFFPTTSGNFEYKTESNTSILTERFEFCQKHFKKYEAFCEDDSQLLCITCILEDGHRQHQIDSIENSVRIQKQKQSDYFDNSRQQEKQANNIIQQINQNIKDLESQAQNQVLDISNFFSEIKKVVNERESLLKSKVQDTLRDQENQMKNLEQYYQRIIQDINEYQMFYRFSCTMQDLEYLKSLIKSKQIISKFFEEIQVDKIKFNQISQYFDSDSEFKYLTKQLLLQKQLNNSFLEQSNPQLQQLKSSQVFQPQTKKQINQNTQNTSSASNNNLINNIQSNNQSHPVISSNNLQAVNNQLQNSKKLVPAQQSVSCKTQVKRVQKKKDVVSNGAIVPSQISSNINKIKQNYLGQKKELNKEFLQINGNTQSQNCQALLSSVNTGHLNIILTNNSSKNTQNINNQQIIKNERSVSTTHAQNIINEINKPLSK